MPTGSEIERLAFQRGTEVAASPNEVLFESTAPGLRCLVSYYLTDPDQSKTVTVGTAVSRMLRGVRSQGG